MENLGKDGDRGSAVETERGRLSHDEVITRFDSRPLKDDHDLKLRVEEIVRNIKRKLGSPKINN